MDVEVDTPSTKLYDFSFLPQNIITLILEYLPFVDFQNAVQACKSWYTASYAPNIIKRIRLLIDDDIETEYIVRPFNKLELNKIDFNSFNYHEFFDTFGAYIEEIEFDRCAVQFTQLMECFAYLTVLHTLQIYDSSKTFSVAGKNLDDLPYDVITENLARVKSLDIYCFFATVDGAEILLKYCKNIEKLVWTSHQLVEPNCTCILNYLRAGNENGTLENLKKFHFYGIAREQSADLFKNLVEIGNLPNLTSLQLQYISSKYYDENFTKFCQNFKQLEYLEIGDVNSQQLADICEYMPDLKCLRLRWTTATNLGDIGKLRQLERLQVDRIEDPDDSTQEIIDMLEAKYENLRELQLNRTHPNILEQLAENYRDLEVLRLHCLTTTDLSPLFQYLRKLKDLQLNFITPMKDDFSGAPNGYDTFNITALTELETLIFSSYVPGMTQELIDQLPKLKASYQADDPYYLPLRETFGDDNDDGLLLLEETRDESDEKDNKEENNDTKEELIKPDEQPDEAVHNNTDDDNIEETEVHESNDNPADE